MRKSIALLRRSIADVAGRAYSNKVIPDDLLEFAKGRRRHERADSVSIAVLQDRKKFREEMDDFLDLPDVEMKLAKSGLKRKRKPNQENGELQQGQAIHLSSASKNWPIFTHLLPEIAFAGHSNSGKSTLVNVIAGFDANKGPASVSDRAGWTDQICFYQVGKRPPVLVLADMPGYGHAIATNADKKSWQLLTRDYLSSRPVLSRCCVLVDSSRGLCSEDHYILNFLEKSKVEWQVLLTKADILSIEDLAKSVALTELRLLKNFSKGSSRLWYEGDEAMEINNSKAERVSHRLVVPLSARTGAGVDMLWKELLDCADNTSIRFDAMPVQEEHGPANAIELLKSKLITESAPILRPGYSNRDPRVREHLNASLLRKTAYLSKK